MRVRAKDELTNPKHNKGRAVNCIRSLGESPNLMRQLRVAAHPFLQLGLYGLLLGREFHNTWVHIAKNGQQQLVCHILQGHCDFAAGKEEGMGGAVHHRWTKWQRLNKSL